MWIDSICKKFAKKLLDIYNRNYFFYFVFNYMNRSFFVRAKKGLVCVLPLRRSWAQTDSTFHGPGSPDMSCLTEDTKMSNGLLPT